LQGSANIQISTVANLAIKKEIAGQSNIQVGTTAFLDVKKEIAGQSNIQISVSAVLLTRKKGLSGSTSINFSTSANMQRNVALSSTVKPPYVVGSFEDPLLDDSGWCDVREKVAYATSITGDSFFTIGFSNPENPVELDHITDNVNLNGAEFVEVIDGYAFITAIYANALNVVTVSNPYSISIVKTVIDGPGQNNYLRGAAGACIVDNIWGRNLVIFIACFQGQRVSAYDISDPLNPTHITTYGPDSTNLDGVVNVQYQDGYLFCVSRWSKKFNVLDVQTKDTITHDNSIDNPPEGYLDRLGGMTELIHHLKRQHRDYLYIASSQDTPERNAGLAIIDIRTPTAPSIVGWVDDSPSGGRDIMRGSYVSVYVPDKQMVLTTSRYTTPGIITKVDVSNPANPVLSDEYLEHPYLTNCDDIYFRRNYVFITTTDTYRFTIVKWPSISKWFWVEADTINVNKTIQGSAGITFSTTAELTVAGKTELAGQADVQFSTTAGLDVKKEFAGQADIQFSTTASLNRIVSLSGSTSVQFSITANLNRTVSIQGISDIQFSTTANIRRTVGLAGQSDIQLSTSANTWVDYALQGQSDIQFNAEGILTIGGQVALAGHADIQISTAASLRVDYILQGSANIQFATSGDLSVKRSIAGQSDISIIAASASMIANKGLVGQSDITIATASADLTVTGAIELQGESSVTLSTSASLNVKKALAGQSDIQFSSIGILTIGGIIPLSGLSIITVGTTASLSNKRSFIGAAAIQISATGGLVRYVQLQGQSDIVFATLAALKITKRLAGSADIMVSCVGNMIALWSLQGSANIQFATSGNLTGETKIAWMIPNNMYPLNSIITRA
jgi:osmotically-inducible protein OsmY